MNKSLLNYIKIFESKKNNGITLIALVITIIVLLILAGVSIAMLTGQNGILIQAQKAKTATEQVSAKEKVEMAVAGAMAKSNTGTVNIDKLKEEIEAQGGIVNGDTLPTTVSLGGYVFRTNIKGEISQRKEGGTLGTVTGTEISNTTVQDALGNNVVVPAGFKIINPTDYITDGIVVEDVSHTATAGSQFVWIPVGDVIKDDKGNTETITLGRYNFDIKGNVSEYSGSYTEDTASNHNSSYGNTIAKDIEDFKNKVNNTTHGYYIGRYEARKNETQLTEKSNDTVYNKITQPEAATLSRGMYTDSNFKSDLMNSYAWDTAIIFLQKFDNRADKTNLYSMQNSLNTGSLANQGTNNLSDASKQDVICNVYDMASNCYELTTETYSDSSGPCTDRGGSYYYSGNYTSHRGYNSISFSRDDLSFRSILYM